VLIVIGTVAGLARDKKSYEMGYSIGWSKGICAGSVKFAETADYDPDDLRDGCIDDATDYEKPGHPNNLNP
jgi:hypothetical protein